MRKFMVLICAVLLVLTGCIKIEIPASTLEKDEPLVKTEVTVPDSSEKPVVPDTPDETPAPQASSENQDIPSPAPSQGVEPTIPSGKESGMLTAYEEILDELYQSYTDPERFQYEDGPSFALFDVDQDGVEELVVKGPVGEASGAFLRVYGYDEFGGKAYLELEETPDFYYYDNGVIEVEWSHNQGAAGDKLWPYTVYQYNTRTGVYEQFARVDGWDKELREVFDGQSFPDALDLDGDGFLYYVITEPGGYAPAYGDAVDYDAYENWRQSYLQSAEPSGFSFLPLVKENISLQ